MRARGLVALALVAGGCQVGTYEVSYDDMVEARRHEAVDRDWVPEWLPEDTTDIHEIHDPASGARVLTATLPSAEAFDRHCPLEVSTPPDVPFPVDEPSPDRAEAMDCGGHGVAVLQPGNRIVLWRGAEPADPPSADATTDADAAAVEYGS